MHRLKGRFMSLFVPWQTGNRFLSQPNILQRAHPRPIATHQAQIPRAVITNSLGAGRGLSGAVAVLISDFSICPPRSTAFGSLLTE
jgi:hypothetical protein